jgi:polyhydroxyalkanoate synthesis repressor PhaR
VAEQMAEQPEDPPPIRIKKYANRRLYNTATASFVTLDDLHNLVKSGERFTVTDAQTGADITCSVLAQIIADEENRGHNMLPPNYLRQVLKLYNEGIGPQLSTYLEQSLDSFTQNQQQMLAQMTRMFSGNETMESWAEAGRRNMELFQQSLNMFARDPAGAQRRAEPHADPQADPKAESKDEEIRSLKRQLEAMQQRLDEMSPKSAPKDPTDV